jgi:two-component system phosphate regulon sensor histidine kinase PhoR
MPIVLIGKDDRIVFANEAAIREFRVEENRLFGIFFRQPDLVKAIDRALHSEHAEPDAIVLRRGQLDASFAVSIRRIELGALCAFEDITSLERADQMRRDFVANVSHELRTPLTSLLGFIETLRGAARDDPAARDRFLGIMVKEAERMNRLVGDLLQLSKVESEERNRPVSEVDLAVLIRNASETLRPIADAAQVKIVTNGIDSPCKVFAAPDQMTQVFTNLIENAIKYGSPAGADVTVNLEVEMGPRGQQVRICVADTGQGIDEQHIPRLTERFYRVDEHRSRQMGGTGLGLAIVKHIVSKHRGRLVIESERGKGSKFSVILPLE